jgi:HTH-type transcriptional regulator/antitoxin HigA
MNISPIKTQRDYRNVLKEIEGLMSAKRNTPEGDRLDVLVTLVEAWERKHYPLDLPDPVEAIKIPHGPEWSAASRPHSLHWQS